jgi:hypothetical protein
MPVSLDAEPLEVANEVVDLAHARFIVLLEDRLDRWGMALPPPGAVRDEVAAVL